MEIGKASVCGTLESSDIMITIEPAPAGAGIEIDLESIVEKEFGEDIRAEIADTLAAMGVERARVTAVDRGALSCTIRARVKTAVRRATGKVDVGGGDGAA